MKNKKIITKKYQPQHKGFVDKQKNELILNRKKLSQGCWITASQQFMKQYKIKEVNALIIECIALSNDSSHIVLSFISCSNVTIRVVDLITGDLIQTLVEEEHTVDFVAISEDLSLVVSGDLKKITIWNVSTGKSIRKHILPFICQNQRLEQARIKSVAINKNASTIVTGSNDGNMRVIDLESGECLKHYGKHDHEVSVAMRESIVVSGSGLNVRVWNLQFKKKDFRIFEGHLNDVTSVAVSQDTSQIASGSDDCSVRLWQTSSGECFHVLKGPNCSVSEVTVSLDSYQVVAGYIDQSVRIWEVASGQCIRIFRVMRIDPEQLQLRVNRNNKSMMVLSMTNPLIVYKNNDKSIKVCNLVYEDYLL